MSSTIPIFGMLVHAAIALLFAVRSRALPVSILPREEDAPVHRTTYDIAWSCFVTIFACVWTSAHPNIPSPHDSGRIRLNRRIIMMIYALIAPEMIAFWAWRQYKAAQCIADDYNATIVGLRKEATAATSRKDARSKWMYLLQLPVRFARYLAGCIGDWWNITSDKVSDRKPGGQWSISHGFFIQMGGFTLYDSNGKAKRVLDYDTFKKLLMAGDIEEPIILESDIDDRGNGDALGKLFVVVQTMWFVVQCIARFANHLPICQLEVATLGFAALNVIIYAIWWNKPQGVTMSVCVTQKQKPDTRSSGGVSAVARGGERNDDTGDQLEESDRGSRDQSHSVLSQLDATGAGVLKDDASELASIAHESTKRTELEALPILPKRHIVKVSMNDDTNILDNGSEARRPAQRNGATGWFRRQMSKASKTKLLLPVYWVIRTAQFMLRPFGKMAHSHTVAENALRVPMFYAYPGPENMRGQAPTYPYNFALWVKKTASFFANMWGIKSGGHSPLPDLEEAASRSVTHAELVGSGLPQATECPQMGAEGDIQSRRLPASTRSRQLLVQSKKTLKDSLRLYPEASAYITSCVIGALFGMVHLVGWSDSSVTPRERLLWRISAIVIIAEPMALLLVWAPSMLIWDYMRSKQFKDEDPTVKKVYRYLRKTIPIVAGLPGYIVARLLLLGLALISLRRLTPELHTAISWTSHIPHI